MTPTIHTVMNQGAPLNIVLFRDPCDGQWLAYTTSEPITGNAEMVEEGSGPHGALQALLSATAEALGVGRVTRLPAIGSGYNPSAWCPSCHNAYPVEGTCECQAERSAASIRRNTFTLLRKLYGPRCADCGQPAESRICEPCLEWRLR